MAKWILRVFFQNFHVIDLLDEAVAAYVTVSVSSANVTLSANDGTTDQSRSPFIELQGEVTSNLNVNNYLTDLQILNEVFIEVMDQNQKTFNKS